MSVRADTDTVGLYGVDSLLTFIHEWGTDSLRALIDSIDADSTLRALVDSLAPEDTSYRAQRYFDALWREERTSSLFPRERRPFLTPLHSGWRHDLVLDSTGKYVAREYVQDRNVRLTTRFDRDQYQEAKLGVTLKRNWRDLIAQRISQQQRRTRGGLGLSITVPGGSRSGFTTIFGKNEVDLNVTGTADIRASVGYRENERQVSLGRGSSLQPEFRQELRLGVTGTIGDKMQVGVNWDSERQFDFENQLKLHYTGYEDEILKSIEAGNVFLQTPSSLIRGGQSLFGIKTELELGGFQLTTVASQQEGQTSDLTLEGGAETTEFDSKSTDYDERKHFFVSYYFRNRWEEALSSPPTILLDAVFSGITDMEVWKLTPVSPEEQNVRQVVAVVDLGEPQDLVIRADGYTEPVRPDPESDQYSDIEIEQELRSGIAIPKDYLESAAMDQPLSAVDFQVGQFKKLELGRDYDLDELLGFITLKQKIQESEALAISFRYLAGGTEIQVGDFSSETGGGDNSQTSDRIVLKLVKPVNLQQPANLGQSNGLNPAAWYLEMRNVYRIGRGLRPTEFVLDVGYEPPGRSISKTLVGISGQQTLIQVLGLDRLNEDGAPRPDDLFDYLPNYSIIPEDGYLFFPYLEPFGQRIADIIAQSSLSPEEKEDARSQLVFDDLYRTKQVNARRNTQLDVYRIQGSFQGTIPSFYDLRAFLGLVQGSVRVTSGGVSLAEGVDFIVDYDGGTVTIINPAHLTAGRDLSIEYEENAAFNLQTKTLLGARLDYAASEKYGFGGTVMRISQKSSTDKLRIGEEPISNLIWGFDGNLDLQPRWLTRAIDVLPLLQTKEPSSISISGEVAQLRPGHTLSNAFEEERRDLRKDGRDFYPDEIDGVSYINDFEGFENIFTLNRPGAWLLSSAPILGKMEDTDGLEQPLENNGRGVLGWYQLNSNTLEEFGFPSDPAVQLVSPQQVFPNREASAQERILSTLDFYFTPHERGPYNYNMDLGVFLDNPRTAWGGMTQRLTEGNTDFTSKNIEFVEFIFQPYPEGQDTDSEARLFVDLGLISEEVIPDNKLNTEDGLSLSEGGPVGQFARLSTGQQDQVINPIRQGERITEDLGLDGLASFPDNKFEQEGGIGTESVKFADFLASLDQAVSVLHPDHLNWERAKAREDPSGDDYHYFLDDQFYSNSAFYPGSASVQQRFSHFFSAHELNTFEAQREFSPSSSRTGNSQLPDTEDINLNSASDTENSYFQYEIPLNRARLAELALPEQTQDYVVGEIQNNQGAGTGWYLVRIPVKEYTRRVGGIQDFTLIESIRVWTTGHTSPITLRFATLEFVGSQWRESESVSNRNSLDEELPVDDVLEGPEISIASVNNEEDASYAIPKGAVRRRLREVQSGQLRDAREQSMVLRITDLEPGRQQAVFFTYTSAEDLLKYRNLRMFAHLDGTLNGQPITEEDRGELTLFLRIGSNETNDYYEYEQPLTASPLDMLEGDATARADYLWRTNQPNPDPEGEPFIDLNSLNIQLSALNQLKALRNEYRDEEGMPFSPTEIFWNDENRVLQESVAAFAPPGTRIGIKGTPSLGRISTLVIGVRNTSEDGMFTDVNVWVNELRVSGYDNDPGIAGLVSTSIDLADLARVKGTFRAQTDGFGSLSSTLGGRNQVNMRDWAVNTQVNMDRFIPERFGWSIPVSVEVKSSLSTPRFDPSRGDIRVTSLLDAVASDSTLTPEEIADRQEELEKAAQTYSETRSYTSRIAKTGSRSRLLRNTIDGLSVTYSFSETEGRRPTQTFHNSRRWNSTVGYRLSVRKPRVVRPFGFLDEVPVVGILGDLRLNYVPTSFTYSITANRNSTRSKQRPDPVRNTTSILPIDVEYPVRSQHKFAHKRVFGLQYNPFGFLNLSFDTNTSQSLNEVGVDTLYTVILVDTLGQESRMDGVRLATLLEQGTIDSAQIGVSAFELTDLETIPFGQVVRRAFSQGVRTENYDSRFNASFRPRLQQYRFLSWLQIQDVSYASTFAWRNGSAGNNTGATVSTNVTTRGGLTIRPQNIFEKFGFYKRLQEQQRAAQNAAQSRRAQREREREQRSKEREQQREERRRLRDARNADEPLEEEEAEGQEEQAEEESRQPVIEQLAAPADSTQQESRGTFAFLPSPVSVFRQLVLAVTSVQDITITYSGSRRSDASNVGQFDEDGEIISYYGLRDALFRGRGPSLRYRLGFDRTIDATQRIINDRLQVTDALSNMDRYQGRTTLNPTRQLRITLSLSRENTDRSSLTYRILDDGSPSADTTHNGSNRVSVWALGASYRDLLSSQLDRFRQDCGAACFSEDMRPDTLQTTALTNEGVFEDFLSSYLSGPGSGGGGAPFPLPNWQVNYTGISQWPLIRRIAQSATLRHGYTADFSSDFRSNLRGGEIDVFRLGNAPLVAFTIPEIEVGSVRINERFQPLLALDLSLKGGIEASVDWNKSNTYSLSTTNNLVGETRTSEISIRASYRRRGMKLPFFKSRLNNSINFSITASRSVNMDRSFLIRRTLEDAVLDENFDLASIFRDPYSNLLTSTVRLRLQPKITYQFSNQVSADAFMEYEKFDGDNRRVSTTTINGGVNLRVNFAH